MKKTLNVILAIIAAACVLFMLYAMLALGTEPPILLWAKLAAVPAIIALLCGYAIGQNNNPKIVPRGTPHPNKT